MFKNHVQLQNSNTNIFVQGMEVISVLLHHLVPLLMQGGPFFVLVFTASNMIICLI